MKKKKLARSKNPAQGHAAARLAERRGMCHAELATRHPVVLAAQVVGILLAQKTGLASPSAEAFPKKKSVSSRRGSPPTSYSERPPKRRNTRIMAGPFLSYTLGGHGLRKGVSRNNEEWRHPSEARAASFASNESSAALDRRPMAHVGRTKLRHDAGDSARWPYAANSRTSGI